MNHAHGPIETTLLQHSQGLRALARGLLGDDHSAEDVVQETWLQALRTRRSAADATIENPGGWLHRVTSRLALNSRRAASRRSQHEKLAARQESPGAPEDPVAEREVMRRVLDAVLELDEPYQSVIVMRYYKDMAPREIAKARGIPAATVASQLHRGRELLRGRLDELHEGDRRTWALALVGALRPDATVGALSLSVSVTTFAKASVAAGAVGVLAVAYAFNGPQDGGSNTDSSPAKLATAGEQIFEVEEDGAARGQDDDTVDGRTPLRAENEPLVAPGLAPLPYVFELTLEVADHRDLPRIGAQVMLAPVGHPLNLAGFTNREGRIDLRWRGRQKRMEVELGLRGRRGLEAGLQRLTLEAGRPLELRIPVGASALLPTRGPSGPSAGGPGPVVPLGPSASSPQQKVLEDWMRTEPRVSFNEELWCTRDEEGMIRFAWPARSVQLVDESVEIFDHNESAAEAIEEIETAHVRGHLQDAEGRPLGNGVILVRSSDSWWIERAEDDGSFDVELEPEGTYDLRAGGGRHGLAFERVVFDEDHPGLERAWQPLLDRGNEVRGRIASEEGAAHVPWLVYCTIDGPKGAYTDSTGAFGDAFAIPNLPAGAGRLELFRPRHWPFAVHSEPVTSPVPFDLEVEWTERFTEGGRVELAIPARDRARDLMLDVRLTQVSTGRTAWLELDHESRRYVRENVPPGRYRLAASDDVGVWQDLGEVKVEAETTHPTGEIRLPEPGILEITFVSTLNEDSRECAWTIIRHGETVDSEVEDWGDLEIFVAPGRYSLVLSDGEMNTVAKEFTVVADEDMSVEIDPDAIGELVLSAGIAGEETRRFELIRGSEREAFYEHEIAPGRDLRLFLPAGEYRLISEELERDVTIVAGETRRVDG